ncbi:thioredoxin family protein [Streptomyces wuyuanensis]|uniref:thioredoxin family protein n=1 Tax=Streptomyces wuyuanensis TaxID=1196353 RepID=UPI003447B976
MDIDHIIQDNMLVVIVFTMPNCGWCDDLKSVLRLLTDDLPDLVVREVNYGEFPDVVKMFDVSAFPTTKFFREGKEIGSIKGFGGEGFFVRKIKEFAAMSKSTSCES